MPKIEQEIKIIVFLIIPYKFLSLDGRGLR
jgi:hypothetical protein